MAKETDYKAVAQRSSKLSVDLRISFLLRTVRQDYA